MTFFNNSILGYQLLWDASLGDNFSGPLGSQKRKTGIGSGGFGNGFTGSFGNTFSSGFGQSRGGFQGFGAQGYPTMLMRQDSVLAQMTHTRDEKLKPGLFPILSNPYRQYYRPGEIGILFSVFDNQYNDLKKKPTLVRQHSFSDSSDIYSASSFSRNPDKLRSETMRSSSSLARANSMFDNITEPMNMDIAPAVIRRQMSLDTEKAKKRSSFLNRRNALFYGAHLLHRKPSAKKNRPTSMSECSQNPEVSDGSSLQSSLDPLDSQNYHTSPNDNTHALQNMKHDPEHKKLIVSLMNPEVPINNLVQDSLGSKKLPKSRDNTTDSHMTERNHTSSSLVPSLSFQQSLNSNPTHFMSDKHEPIHEELIQHTDLQSNKPNTESMIDQGTKQSINYNRSISHETPRVERSTSQTSQQLQSTNSKGSINKMAQDPEHENVTSSLTNPEKVQQNCEIYETMRSSWSLYPELHKQNLYSFKPISYITEEPEKQSFLTGGLENYHLIPVEPYESPTLVCRRIHQFSHLDDLKCPNEIYSMPLSSTAITGLPANSPAAQQNAQIMHKVQEMTNNVQGHPLQNISCDSDTSELYYDCVSNYIEPIENEDLPFSKDKLQPSSITSKNTGTNSCTNIEHTSTENGSPHETYCNIQSNSQPGCNSIMQDNYEHNADKTSSKVIGEADTSKVQGKALKSVHTQHRKPFNDDVWLTKSRDSVENIDHSFSKIVQEDRSDYFMHVCENLLKDENYEDNQDHELESPTSEKVYVSKVMQSMNLLAKDPFTEESNFFGSCDNLGSDTESHFDEDNVNHSTCKLDVEYVSCISGSDSECYDNFLKSDEEESNCEPEVIKLLDSPTAIRQRVSNQQLTQYEETRRHQTVLSRRSSSSQTDLMQALQTKHGAVKVQEDWPKQLDVDGNDISNGKQFETISAKRSTKTASSLAENDKFGSQKQFLTVYQNDCTDCVDIVLHLLNFALFLSNSGVISMCIWLLAKHFNVNDVSEILGNNLILVIVYTAISGAAVALLAVLCFCFGMKHDGSGLGFYACVLVTVVIAFLLAAVHSLIFLDKLGGVEFHFEFKERLVTLYGVDLKNVQNQVFTRAWDNMQEEYECCGAFGNENDTESWELYKISLWFRKNPNRANVYVPKSCCRKDSNVSICQGGDNNLFGPPRYMPPLSIHYPHRNPNLNTNGCYEPLSNHTILFFQCMAIVTGILAGLTFLTAIITWIFCLKKSKDCEDNYTNDDSSWYNKDSIENNFPNEHMGSGELNNVIENIAMNELHLDVDKSIARDANNQNKCPGRNSTQMEKPELHRNLSNISHHGEIIDSTESSDINHDSEDGQYCDKNTAREATERRNLWLTSRTTAGHILSFSIEEEDSNCTNLDVETNCNNPNSQAY